ncbi:MULTISPECIES: hypothetical protein [Sinorhizobium]|uniref:hypothetical protein n=1 Tax=Sinorhizobium TaxID=28105 RepID=UPI0011427C17|nr:MULTISPECIES: hypothetical protein [Sinorhizobium]
MGRFLLFPLPGRADWQSQERKSNALMLCNKSFTAGAVHHLLHLRRRNAQRDCQRRSFADTLKKHNKDGMMGRGDPDGEERRPDRYQEIRQPAAL